jgi:hypothetical protein
LSRPVAGRRTAVVFHPTKTSFVRRHDNGPLAAGAGGLGEVYGDHADSQLEGPGTDGVVSSTFRCRHFAMGSRRLAPRQAETVAERGLVAPGPALVIVAAINRDFGR